MLPPQNGNLVAQHQQLGVLRRLRARQQHHPASQADEHQVEHPDHHKPAMLPATRLTSQANPQVSRYTPFWNPTGYGKIIDVIEDDPYVRSAGSTAQYRN